MFQNLIALATLIKSVKACDERTSLDFKGLKIHKIKSRRRGNQLLGYEFTFQKETTQKWIDDKFGNAGETKNAPPGSKTPEWYDPDYKNETTQKAKKSLKELSKSL